MFKRSLTALLGMLLIAGTLAVASAMATEEPSPPQPPTTTTPVPGNPGVPVTPRVCVDHMRPLSRLRVHWERGFRHGVIRGVAIDQGCGPAGAGKVKRVSVAIARKAGKRCQSLQRSGRLGRARACHQVWLPAKGSATWTFRLRHRLPRGTYFVSTRAVDSAGNLELRLRR